MNRNFCIDLFFKGFYLSIYRW